jgi:tRNA dimethylallyltransferase
MRQQTQARFDALGEAAFREALAAVDPAAARRIAPGDRQRLTRAMEVHAASGRSISQWQAGTRPALPAGSWRAAVLEPERAALYARCDERLAAVVRDGALEEVRRLMARGLDPALPVMKAVGVRELAAHLEGRLSLGEALALAQRETRRYAKRQSTWLRNQTPDWPRLTQAGDIADFLGGV